jgi:hypothetical protein
MKPDESGELKEASAGRKVATLLWSCGCVAVIMLFMAAIAGPKLISARIPGNEAAAVGGLKTLSIAQQLFREGGECYGALADLEAKGLVDAVLGSGEKQGYRFECLPAADEPGLAWWASAAPLTSDSGGRYFAVTHEGIIYHSYEGPIAVDPATAAVPVGTSRVGE